jgi:hypothetical protein
MRSVECAYCGLDDYDQVDQTMIEYLFGIRHCAAHGAAAKRDCNAFLHEVGKVPMWAIRSLPALKSLHDLSHTNFTITRSSGESQSGWSINYGSLDSPLYITREGADWVIPMINHGLNLMKNVRINGLQETHPSLAEAHAALDAGVYRADYESRNTQLISPIREHHTISTVMRADGSIGRVYTGHLPQFSINQ